MANKPRTSSGKPWMRSELELIKDCVASRMTDAQIHLLLPNRSVQAIHAVRVIKLGMKNWVTRRFTPEEDAIIKEMFLAYADISEIAKATGRTGGAVRKRVFDLGINREAKKTWLANRYGKKVLAIHEDANVIQQVMDANILKQIEAKALERQSLIEEALAKMVQYLTPHTTSERRKYAMQQARLAGCTLQEIGTALGVTKERVRQITHNVKTKPRFHRSKTEPIFAKRLVICKRCNNSFTVESRGNFKYCLTCYPIVKAEYEQRNRAAAKVWQQNNRNRKARAALKLIHQLSLDDKLEVKNETENGSGHTSEG